MKGKMLLVLSIGILLLSALDAVQAVVQCPRCGGTGKITSQICSTCEGSGVLEPTITLKDTFAGASGSQATFVKGVFHNEEDVGVYGNATATVKTQVGTYTNTSLRTYFPPNEDVTVTLIVEGVAFYERYPACFIELTEVEPVTCPDCSGTGVGIGIIDCPDCDGTGFVTAREDGINLSDLAGAIGGVAVVAVVAIGAVVLVKRKRMTEKDLRKLPLSEFQNWVIKKLAGNTSSLRDSHMGIDGYTIEGQPISIKQSDGVGRSLIENFAAAIGRSKAKNGIIVAFSFGSDAYTGMVKAKLDYGIEIKMVTVKELIERRKTILL